MKDLLLFVRAGNTSIHRTWQYDPSRVDLVVSAYSESIESTDGACTYFGGYNKFEHFAELVEFGHISIEKYRYFMLIDDDIAIDYPLENLIAQADRFCIYIGQPSLGWRSYYTFPLTLWNPAATFRDVNFIEVMCPIFSAEALRESICTFRLSKSTWGIDVAYSEIAVRAGKPLRIIDTIKVTHCKEIKLLEGAWYKKLHADGTDPKQELAKIALRFGGVDERVAEIRSKLPWLATLFERRKAFLRRHLKRLGFLKPPFHFP